MWKEFRNFRTPLIAMITKEEHVLFWHLNKLFPWDKNSFLLLFLLFTVIHDADLRTWSYPMSCKGQHASESVLHTVGA